MYGIVKRYLRIPDDQFKYWNKYVYVDHGFFRVRNIFRPTPIGFLAIIAHVLYLIGIYTIIANKLWTSLLIAKLYEIWGGIAVTGGTHRLWCHRAYSAKLPLRIFLMLGQSMTLQYTIYSWSVGHRVHHKYSDTDADPHTTSRGFFFVHAGWMFTREHPDVSMKERLYNYSDLDKEGVVAFQHKYYYYLMPIMAVMLPISIQMYFAGDTLWQAILIGVVIRILSAAHDTAFVNSAAHMFGDRPYNSHIPPTENYYVTLASFGEGYHNYHHSFPWDYKAAELGSGFNSTTIFIDLMYYIGQAYNLKTASDKVIEGGRRKNGYSKIKIIKNGDANNNDTGAKRKIVVQFGQNITDMQSRGVGVEVEEHATVDEETDKEILAPIDGTAFFGSRSY